MKVRPGPAVGSKPKAKTLGMIMSPPMIDASTPRKAIQRQERMRFVSSLR